MSRLLGPKVCAPQLRASYTERIKTAPTPDESEFCNAEKGGHNSDTADIDPAAIRDLMPCMPGPKAPPGIGIGAQ